jgi:ATP-binding cassette, subfamily B (MDR/TAP), member 1
MQIVFGNLVGEFNNYFTPGRSTSKSDFDAAIDRMALYLFLLFIGKFVFCYIALVSAAQR